MSDATATTTPASPARLAANRANARKSTGPRSPEGKARSRANSVKHGLTGAGVVRPPEFRDEIQSKLDAYHEALSPRDDVERDLARASALGAWRFQDLLRRERAEARRQAACADFDRQRRRDALIDRLTVEPERVVHALSRSVAGIDWMLDQWHALAERIASDRPWSDAQRERALNLLGLTHRGGFDSAGHELMRADLAYRCGDPHILFYEAMTLDGYYRAKGHYQRGSRAIVDGLPSPGEGRVMLSRLIAEHVDRLVALREALRVIEQEDGPEEAPPPWEEPSAALRLRYESAARATWQGSLRRLQALQDRSGEAPPLPNEPNALAPAPPLPNEPNDPTPAAPVPNEPNEIAERPGGRPEGPAVPQAVAPQDEARSIRKPPAAPTAASPLRRLGASAADDRPVESRSGAAMSDPGLARRCTVLARAGSNALVSQAQAAPSVQSHRPAMCRAWVSTPTSLLDADVAWGTTRGRQAVRTRSSPFCRENVSS
jgi:hypothetical protein